MYVGCRSVYNTQTVRWHLGGHSPSWCCHTGLMIMVVMGCKWDCIRSCAHGVFNFIIIILNLDQFSCMVQTRNTFTTTTIWISIDDDGCLNAWLTHCHPIFHAFPPRCRILSVGKRGVVPWKERSDPRGVTAERGIKMVAGRSGGFSSRQAVLVVTSPSAGLTWCTHHVDGETRSSCDDVII